MIYSGTFATLVLLLVSWQVSPSAGEDTPHDPEPARLHLLILGESGSGVINALLQDPAARSGTSDLRGRQTGTCDPGYLHCTNEVYCCPIGTYCGVWGGKKGCCTIGKICSGNDDPCEFEDYLPCTGENFCCPSGSTCSRSSSGAAQCSGPLNTLSFPGITTSTRNTFASLPTILPTITTTRPPATATFEGGGPAPPGVSSSGGDPQPKFDGNGAMSLAASPILVFVGIVINFLV